MKLNQNTTSKIFRTANWQLPPFDFKKNTADLVIPFIVKSGFINATEEGNTFSEEVTNYSRFERIFTGFESVIIEWEDSTSTIVKNNKLVKQFKTGRKLSMWVDHTQNVDEVNELQEDTSFLTERVVSTVTAYTEKEISELDLIKMYTFPNKYGKVLFHIDTVTSYNDPNSNQNKYHVVTFKSVNDRLSNTGISINQYIQNAAPGEGYAYPQPINIIPYRELHDILRSGEVYKSINDVPSSVVEGDRVYVENYRNNSGISKIRYSNSTWHNDYNSEGVILNEYLLKSNPVKSMQIEIFGKGILSDVYFYGRPLVNTKDERDNEIKQSRQLLLNKPQQANQTQRDITQPYARNTAYNWIKKSQLVVESWYDSWSEQRKASVNPGSTKKWMGALEIFYGTADETVTVNPFLRAIGDVLSFGILESFWPTTVEFKKAQGTDSTVYDIKPDSTGLFDFSTMFNNNFYRNKPVTRLPVSYEESVCWSFKDIPLIGGFLNSFTLGFNRGWRQSTDLGGKHYNVSGIIPTGLLDFYQNAYMPPKKKASTALGGDNAAYTAIPLDDLQSDSSPSSISKVDYATILNYTLTDQFTDAAKMGTIGQRYQTEDLNYQDSSGNKLVVWDQNLSHAIDPLNVDGYAIDLFGIHFVGDADIKVTFFDKNNNSVWTTKLKTLSQLTESVRDWNTTYKLSSWSAPTNTVIDQKTPYKLKPEDYTIDISPSTQDKLRNGFPKSDTSHGSYKKNDQGEIELDNNGQPIVLKTSSGLDETIGVSNLVDGSIDNISITPQTNQKIAYIQEFTLPISPTRILDIAGHASDSTTNTITIRQILDSQKFEPGEVLQFSKILIKPTFRTTDSGFKNAYAGTDDKTYSYDLVYDIRQVNGPEKYVISLGANYTPISDSRDSASSWLNFGDSVVSIKWSIDKTGKFSITGGDSNFGQGNTTTYSYFDLKEIIFIK